MFRNSGCGYQETRYHQSGGGEEGCGRGEAAEQNSAILSRDFGLAAKGQNRREVG